MLKVIYGKAGSGKTSALIEIAKKLHTEGRKALFIVPETYSLAMEKRIVREFGAGFSPQIDVLTFERLPSQIYSRFGPMGHRNFGKMARQMIIQKILLKHEKKLNIFAKSFDTTDFAEKFLVLFDEFERYIVAPYALEMAMPNEGLQGLKYADILLIYKAYVAELEVRSVESGVYLSNRLDYLYENGINPFENTTILLDQFDGWTPNEYEVIKRFLLLASDVTVTFSTDSLAGARIQNSGFRVQASVERLFELAAECGVLVAPNTYLKGERQAEKTTIFTSINPYNEVCFVAREIRKLVLEEGIAQNEVAVIANNSSFYGGLIAQIFPKFGIDCFIDDARPALKSAEIQGVIALLNVFANNFSSPFVLKYLKSAPCDVDKADLDLLENYYLAAGISPNVWLGKAKLKFVPRGFDEAQMADVQDIIDEQMGDLRAAKLSGRKTVNEIIDMCGAMWASPPTPVAEVLGQMESIFGDEYISFSKFVAIFRAGLGACELTSLPKTRGQVHFCGADRYKGHSPRALFIMGASQGEFPRRHIGEGIISDSERVVLGAAGIALADTARAKQLFEEQTVYFCTHSASERLYLTHPKSGFDGKEISPSSVLSRFENANRRTDIYDKRQLGLTHNNVPITMISKSAKRLYESKTHTSVSQVEKFSSCPYSYFMRYGMGAKPRHTNAIGTPDSGIIIHNVIERFCKLGDFENLDTIPAIIQEAVCEIFSETIRENPRFKSTLIKIENIFRVAIHAISQFYASSDFEPLGFEMDLPEMTIKLDNGREIRLMGRADRVDIRRTAKGNFINLVDYKSYDESLDFVDMNAGVQIQLPIYIKAICDSLSKSEKMPHIPANMLYFHVDAPHCDLEENWDEILRKLRMKGLVLMQDGQASIPAEFGILSVKSKCSLDDINRVCEDAYAKMQGQLNRLMGGEISLAPYRHGEQRACDYCDYKAVCRFDVRKEGNNYAYGSRVD